MKINFNNESEIVVDLNKLTSDEIDKFSELIEKARKPKSKIWKPMVGDEYWSIDSDGDTIWNYVWHNNDLDEQHYSIGNCFQTRENAVDAIERLKIRAELRHYADEYNDKIDWKDGKQDKWYIYFDYINGRLDYNRLLCNRDSFQIYFTSEEIAQDAVKAVGEERIKKYLFGVES